MIANKEEILWPEALTGNEDRELGARGRAAGEKILTEIGVGTLEGRGTDEGEGARVPKRRKLSRSSWRFIRLKWGPRSRRRRRRYQRNNFDESTRLSVPKSLVSLLNESR